MEFCRAFNEKTKGKEGLVLPVVISAYEDRTFSFIIKSPAGAILLKQTANIAKAAGLAGREEAGAVTRAEVREIAKTKLKDLNTTNVEKAIKTIEGTARSMGITVVETDQEKQKILAQVREQTAEEEKTEAAQKATTEESKKDDTEAAKKR